MGCISGDKIFKTTQNVPFRLLVAKAMASNIPKGTINRTAETKEIAKGNNAWERPVEKSKTFKPSSKPSTIRNELQIPWTVAIAPNKTLAAARLGS